MHVWESLLTGAFCSIGLVDCCGRWWPGDYWTVEWNWREIGEWLLGFRFTIRIGNMGEGFEWARKSGLEVD